MRRRESLVGQVVAVNVLLVVAVLFAATAAAGLNLAVTDERLRYGAIAMSIILLLGINMILLRRRFSPLETLITRLEEIDPAQPTTQFVVPRTTVEEVERLAITFRRLLRRIEEERRRSGRLVLRAQEEERRRLARDLHDGIGQAMIVLRLRMGMALGVDGPGVDGAGGPLAEIADELDHTIEQLREVSHNLYPAILRDRGLAAAVRSYASRLPVESTLTVTPDPLPRVPMDVESGAYFLLCESVTNALKHARANELSISLAVGDGSLRVELHDDGRGFDLDSGATRRGGLLHMEDRVRSFGGQLSIRSAPGQGTTVTATFPATSSAAAERTAPPPPGGSYLVPR